MPRSAIDLYGQRFGRLVVIGRAESGSDRRARWQCQCDCGKAIVTSGASLVRGHSTSCGCYRAERVSQAKRTHGESSWRGHPASTEYRIWRGIVERCENPNNTKFDDYGGRGIRICAAWRNSFQVFLRDVGRRPSRLHSLDRIRQNGSYEPGNVRWATSVEQNRNRRSVRLLTIDDEPIGFNEVARRLAMAPSSLRFHFHRAGVLEAR